VTTTLACALEDGRAEDIARSVMETVRKAKSMRAWAVEELAPALRSLRDEYERQRWRYPELVRREAGLLEGIRLCEREIPGPEQEDSPVVVVATMTGEPYQAGKDIVGKTMSLFGLRVVDAGIHRTPRQLARSVLHSHAEALCVCLFASLPSAVLLAGKTPPWLARTPGSKTTKTVLAGYGASRQLASELGFDGYAGDGAQAARVVQDLCLEVASREDEGKGASA